MISVPLAERRHRLNPDEIEPVMWATYDRLLRLLDKEAPGTLDEAQSLYRIWFRINRHVHNKPAYGPHESWEEIAAQLPTNYGTVKEAP